MKTLVMTGSMGAGKTTMIGELSDLLAASGVAHAAIDIDALGSAHDPRAAIDLAAIAYRNLAAVVRNYADEGVTSFVMAGAIENAPELARLRDAIGEGELVVCRLRAPVDLMENRVRVREPGMWREKYVGRVALLEETLDEASLEDFTVANDGSRPITEVAREILQRAGW